MDHFPLQVHGSEPRCDPSGAFGASIQSSRKCLFFKMYYSYIWLVTVHPRCYSRLPIHVTTTKRNLCTKTSGPGCAQWIFIALAMLTNYLIAWINTFPPKPVGTTETICCNIFPPAARAAFWHLEEARRPGRDC